MSDKPSRDAVPEFAQPPYPVETSSNADILLHIYHCDQWTGWLNKWWLKDQEIPIYHLGVEVYGEEWSFLYFEDSWDDESVSGVIRCEPKCMADYDYQESINLGPTPLNEDEVDEILLRLHYEYPACTYHLTRRNCLTFAHDLVGCLRTPEPFPLRLKGIVDAASQAPRIDGAVDYGWSWAKWYMLKKHNTAQQPTAEGEQQPSGYFCCTAGGADRQSSMWSLLLTPSYTCTGKMCPAGPKGKIEGIDDHVVPTALDEQRQCQELKGSASVSPDIPGLQTKQITPEKRPVQ